MPKSKNRPHVHHHQQQHADHGNKPSVNKVNRAVAVMMIFFSILGLLISYLTVGGEISWLLAGTAAGAIAGYVLGKQVI